MKLSHLFNPKNWLKRSLGSPKFYGAQVASALSVQFAADEIRYNINKLRVFSRRLEIYNPYGARYLSCLEDGVIGAQGINIKVSSDIPQGSSIQAKWLRWCQSVTPDGLSWGDFRRLVERRRGSDGETFILKNFIDGKLSLTIVDPDRVPVEYNRSVDNTGTRVVMGIHLDSYDRPLGYYVRRSHPSDYSGPNQLDYFPADRILHYYDPQRLQGFRGIPDLTPVFGQLELLERLDKALLQGAIHDAQHFAYISAPAVVPETFGEPQSPEAALASLQARNEGFDALRTEIGSQGPRFGQLPEGATITFPSKASPRDLDAWRVGIVKSIASGLNVSYYTLSSDSADANMSANKVALMLQNSLFRVRQARAIASVDRPLFRAWLECEVISGANLPNIDLIAQYTSFTPRGFESATAKDDLAMAQAAVRSGLKTLHDYYAENGKDYDDELSTLESEAKDLAARGLKFDLSSAGIAQSSSTIEVVANETN